jgi:MGT family glycosyltransferase
VLRAQRHGRRAVAGLVERIACSLVYVTFGTVLGYISIATGIYRTVLEAVKSLEARVLLTVGHQFDPSNLGPLPANVHLEAWVEQADVLGSADVVVCHGGSRTVFGALAAAVPLVVAPLFADQFENARRIAAVGAGALVEVERRSADAARHGPDVKIAGALHQGIEAVLAEA